MRKRDEIGIQNSCFNKARDDEILFVLLERDAAAADTIRYWINKRIELGKNKYDDAKMIEAANCADTIDRSHGKP